MYNSTRHSVFKVITIGWGHLQSASNKPLKIVLPCKLIFWKATKIGSPPNFPKLISQLRGIPQPQYFVPSLLEPHWTYLWKHYIYHKKDTQVGSQILATKFGFVPDCWCVYFLVVLRRFVLWYKMSPTATICVQNTRYYIKNGFLL